ncbi:MAG: CpsB/CapC family capsule biosynthesis tyrosine phosphatase [Polyangiales bacterium]
MSSGFVDLHCHYLPGIDDGVRSQEQGLALLAGLGRAGFTTVVATPHIRARMFDNDKQTIESAFSSFREVASRTPNLPEIGLGAEHHVDELFQRLLGEGGLVPYPGGHAVLLELPPERWPLRLEHRLFEVGLRRLKPVLAHPERYAPLFATTKPLDPLIDAGALPMLDLLSLVGKYGRAPQKAAERMLAEDVYYAACSDCHKPEDVPHVVEAIARLERLVGRELALELLSVHPRRILDGTAEY